MSMSDDGGLLQRAVNEKSEPVYMATYQDVAEYYKDTFKPNQWIGAMAQAISGSDSKNSKEYKAARRSIERHETGQYKGNAKTYVDRIAAAGMKLNPVARNPKDGQISLTVSGYQEGHGDRSFSVHLKGTDAYSFVNSPSYYNFFKALGYPDGVIALFANGQYELVVTSVS